MCCWSVLMSLGLDFFLIFPKLRAFGTLFVTCFCLCCMHLDLGFRSFGGRFFLLCVLRIVRFEEFLGRFRRFVGLLALLLEMKLICWRYAFLGCVLCLCIRHSHIVFMDCGHQCYLLHLLLGQIFYDFLKIYHAFTFLLKMSVILKM